jgi:hypothetical protein
MTPNRAALNTQTWNWGHLKNHVFSTGPPTTTLGTDTATTTVTAVITALAIATTLASPITTATTFTTMTATATTNTTTTATATAVARIECPKAYEAKVVVINKILNSCELCSSLK